MARGGRTGPTGRVRAVALAALLAAALAGCGRSKPQAPPAEVAAAPVPVTAEALAAAFDANVAAGDAAYTGRLVEVEGEVIVITKSEEKAVYLVQLAAPRSTYTVLAVFDEAGDGTAHAAKLVKGRRAKIVGTCTGQTEDPKNPATRGVFVKQCRVP